MKTSEIYDVSAELEKEFGAKGTPQREAAQKKCRTYAGGTCTAHRGR